MKKDRSTSERSRIGSGEWIRTTDLRVMSPTSYHCSTPRRRLQVYAICAVLSADLQPEGWARVAAEWPWHRPIFPVLGDPSIVGAGAFHYRVRHGNGWDHSALATRTIRSLYEKNSLCVKVVEQTDA